MQVHIASCVKYLYDMQGRLGVDNPPKAMDAHQGELAIAFSNRYSHLYKAIWHSLQLALTLFYPCRSIRSVTEGPKQMNQILF